MKNISIEATALKIWKWVRLYISLSQRRLLGVNSREKIKQISQKFSKEINLIIEEFQKMGENSPIPVLMVAEEFGYRQEVQEILGRRFHESGAYWCAGGLGSTAVASATALVNKEGIFAYRVGWGSATGGGNSQIMGIKNIKTPITQVLDEINHFSGKSGKKHYIRYSPVRTGKIWY